MNCFSKALWIFSSFWGMSINNNGSFFFKNVLLLRINGSFTLIVNAYFDLKLIFFLSKTIFHVVKFNSLSSMLFNAIESLLWRMHFIMYCFLDVLISTVVILYYCLLWTLKTQILFFCLNWLYFSFWQFSFFFFLQF